MQTIKNLGAVFQSLILLIAVGLQIWAGRWRLLFEQKTATGELGTESLLLVAIDIALCLFSGVLISVILFPREKPSAIHIWPLIVGSSILLVSIGIKLASGLTSFQLPGQLSLQILIWNWVLSGLPSTLLGMTFAAMYYRLGATKQR